MPRPSRLPRVREYWPLGRGSASASRSTTGVIPNCSSIGSLHKPRRLDKPRHKPGRSQQVGPPAELRVDATQEIVQMRRQKASDLVRHGVRVHEQAPDDHAVGHRLGRDGEEEKPGLLATLVLMVGIAESQDQGLDQVS